MGLDLNKSGKNLLPPTDGRIAIGMKNDRGLPTKVDYFLFTHQLDPKNNIAPINKEMTEAMKAVYGDKPRKIRVILPFHHVDEVFYTSYTDWKGRTEWSCKSEDGCTACRKQANGSVIEVPCDYDNCTYRLVGGDPNKTTCKPNGILSVFIMDAPIVGGVWKFRTTSWGSVNKILQALKMIFNVRGSLKGLEVLLTITMEPQMVPDGKGGRQKQNVPNVTIQMPCSMQALRDGAGTVLGDFQEIKAMSEIRGNIADKAMLSALSKEISTPPSSIDETDETTSVESEQQEATTQTSTPPPPISTQTQNSSNTSGQYQDDDLF